MRGTRAIRSASRSPIRRDSRWRNRAEFLQGRDEIEAFLTRKWRRELDYRLIKEIWAFRENRIAVRFAYEWHDDSGTWFRSYGNENWEFDEHGLMRLRIASINDLPIAERDRKYHWPLGRRPDDHPGLSDLGLVAAPLCSSAQAVASAAKRIRGLSYVSGTVFTGLAARWRSVATPRSRRRA